MYRNPTSQAILPVLILHFDGVFNIELTLGKAKHFHQAEEEAYIEANLREPKVLKALLDSAHEKGFRIYLLAYVPDYIQNNYLQGTSLILKYLDKSLGVNRKYLTTDFIYSYDNELTSQKFYTILQKLIAHVQPNSDNISFIHVNPFFGPGATQTELQSFLGNSSIHSILVDDEGDYLNQLSSLINFKQGFYNSDPTIVAAYHQVTKGVIALSQDLATKERETNRRALDRLLIEAEKVFLGITKLIFEDYQANSQNYKTLNDVINVYQTQFSQCATHERKKFDDFLATHPIGSEESQFTTIYQGKLDTLIKNYRTPLLNTFSQDSLKDWCIQSMRKLDDLDDLWRQAVAYKQQKEQEKLPIQQAIDEENKKRLALQQDDAARERKELYNKTTSKGSIACIEGNLEAFRKTKHDQTGIFKLTEEEFINRMDDVIGMAPIHLACEFGHVAIIDYLTQPERRCNLELSNDDQESGKGYPPLHIAVRANQQKVMQLLLHKGVNPNARGRFGRTALHMAIQYGVSLTIIRLLINAGANINSADFITVYDATSKTEKLFNNETPLHLAARMGRADVVGMLLEESKINYRQLNHNQETALVTAIFEAQLSVALQFIESGLWLTRKEWDKLLPDINKLSNKSKVKAIVELLEEIHGAPLNQLAALPNAANFVSFQWRLPATMTKPTTENSSISTSTTTPVTTTTTTTTTTTASIATIATTTTAPTAAFFGSIRPTPLLNIETNPALSMPPGQKSEDKAEKNQRLEITPTTTPNTISLNPM